MDPEKLRKLFQALRGFFGDAGQIGGEFRSGLQRAEERMIPGMSALERAEKAADPAVKVRELEASLREVSRIVQEFERMASGGEALGRMTRDALEEAGVQLGGKLPAIARGRAAIIPMKPVELIEPRWVYRQGPMQPGAQRAERWIEAP